MNINDTIGKALAQAGLDTRTGPLKGVTDTIRQALASAGLGGGFMVPPADTDTDTDVIEVAARNICAQPAPQGRGEFRARTIHHCAGVRDYKLYRPAARAYAPGEPRPLVVMLHGCTQSADDFAAGTQMNRLADEHGFLVLYPEQSASANASRCWNWFRPQDQLREGGEPALIAAMVQAVMDEHPVDAGRVYVAGLSAGAAMAVILGETWPDRFAAVGAHSGLPFAAAHDIPSALAAMKGRGTTGDPWRRATRAVPTIVFHGDRDHTVRHSNGEHITEQARRAEPALSARSETGTAAGGRRYTREIHTDATGRARVEHWTVHGAGHAWSGGDAAGSCTDNAGPDASAEMLRFFLAQPPRG
ncbi:extracellular catalytic domain type 1 short-chain-length polyhydroxyalkanoate depolymerase [Hydrogenophaga sp. PBL-H3]|uniref:extracellular catalytic domain type 1 short-chain-length polyhydroxyalkanoate depolymerase n=1 Tax=Hydrogenophaga sp. PBL-H3 TaxID=434010 RepID=UPI001F21D05C|nr:PHB depolymerase family esterase [Hydrogenophaga sp. PBL-H3]